MGRNLIHQQAVSVLLALVMVLNIFQFAGVTAFAQDNDSGNKDSEMLLSTLQNSSRTVLYLDDGVIEFGSGRVKVNGTAVTVNPAGYIITQKDSGAAPITNKNILVTGGTQNITLLNVNIDGSGSDGVFAFSIAAGAAVNLTLEGKNTLKSGAICAGFEVPHGAALTVTAESTGSLNVYGGKNGAGIGGGSGGAGGTISINGGTVTAYGGKSSAGIGGGSGEASGNITISGGSVKTVDANGNFSVSGSITDGKGHIEHCVTLNTGFGANAAVLCSVNDGKRFSCKTDSDGRLYLWMPEGRSNVKIYYDSFRYTFSVSSLTANISATLDDKSKKVALNIENDSISFSDGTVTQGIRAYMTDEAVIFGTSGSNTVSVSEGTHSITLDNLNINVSACAFSISSGASVTLLLENENTLKSGYSYAGLHVPDNALLIIAAQSTGSLNAIGGEGGAGMGGNFEQREREYLENENHDKKSCSGNITINGGTVTASGGSCQHSICGGAGIGGAGSHCLEGSIGGDGGNITISGGTVTAIGGDGFKDEWYGLGGGGAGIGGGGAQGSEHSDYDYYWGNNISGQSGNITISGGNVRATGGEIGGAGIGSGGICGQYGNAGDVDSIVITGTNTKVYAEGKGEFVSDIGSGYRCRGISSDGGGRVDTIAIGEPNNAKKPLPTVCFAGTDNGTSLFGFELQFSNCVITGKATNLNGTYDANGRKISTGLSDTKSTDSNHDINKSQTALPATVTDKSSGMAADLSGAVMPLGVTSVTLSTAQKSTSDPADPQAVNVCRLAVSDTKLGVIGTPVLYDLKLLDQNGSVIFGFGGKVKVQIPVPAGLRGTPHIFRYEESTGIFTDMNAVIENGFLVFETDHFSYYAVAGTGDSITLDTTSYTMPVKGQYQIGLKLTGTKAASVKFYSTNNNVVTVVKLKNGNYKVAGVKTGTAYVMFDIYDNKNMWLTHASVKVTVQNGVKSNGNSARQIGLF